MGRDYTNCWADPPCGQPQRRSHNGRVRLSAPTLSCRVLAYVAGAVAVAGVLTGCGSGGPGPLQNPEDDGTSVAGILGVAVKPGQVDANDMMVLGPISSQAVLLDVRLQHPRDASGLTIRYAAMRLHGGTTGALGWHPARWNARPVNGFVIKAHTAAAIWVGVAAAKPGRYRLTGFFVDYRMGDTRYSAHQGIGLDVCVRVRFRSCSFS